MEKKKVSEKKEMEKEKEKEKEKDKDMPLIRQQSKLLQYIKFLCSMHVMY